MKYLEENFIYNYDENRILTYLFCMNKQIEVVVMTASSMPPLVAVDKSWLLNKYKIRFNEAPFDIFEMGELKYNIDNGEIVINDESKLIIENLVYNIVKIQENAIKYIVIQNYEKSHRISVSNGVK